MSIREEYRLVVRKLGDELIEGDHAILRPQHTCLKDSVEGLAKKLFAYGPYTGATHIEVYRTVEVIDSTILPVPAGVLRTPVTGGLFQRGDFQLHSGEHSNFKIDCDALTDTDIETAAFLLSKRLPAFGKVQGIPQGGLRLAAAMRLYATAGPLLLVDDVWTTGRSLNLACGGAREGGRHTLGAVLFARKPPDSWVKALFTML
jgi:hypothetical protein